jgi:hypothetical protein
MRTRTIKLAALIVIALSGFAYPLLDSTGTSAETEPQRSSQTKRRPQVKTPAQPPTARYSKFSHSVSQHQRACDACHKFPTANWKTVRQGDAAFPDVTEYPEHASCVGCHRRQFFSGDRPVICSVCHASVSPRGGPRHPFPNPSEVFDASEEGRTAVSEFGISFPHDKHVDIVGQGQTDHGLRRGVRFVRVAFRQKSEPKAEESEPKSCAVCHKTYQPQGDSDEEFVTKPPKNLADDAFWLKKGAFKTAPTSHATCFACHSEDSGLKPAPSDCGICHKLLPPGEQIKLTEAHSDFDPKLAAAMGISDKTTLEKWSRRHTAKFRHEWLPHAGLSCTSCHNVAAMNTLDEKTRKVAVRSCGGEGTGCHIEATTEGILNLELEKKKANPSFECSKCHIHNGSKPAPETHINAITAAKKK